MLAEVRAALNAASKRLSSERPATLASFKSRSTMVKRLLISSRLVASGFSQPYSAHFSKVTFVSNQENLVSPHHGIQKVISVCELRLEFCQRVNRRINGSAERPLKIANVSEYVLETHLTDNQQVDIAFGLFLAPSQRTVNEGDRDAVCNGGQSLAQGVNRPYRLRKQGAKFREHRMVLVGPVENLFPYSRALHKP